MSLRLDLRIYSCLTPFAELDNSPRSIVRRAVETGLDAICVCDLNSAAQLPVMERLCAGGAGSSRAIQLLPGVTAFSVEEIHTVGVFSDVAAAEDFSRLLQSRMPEYRHDPARLGYQAVLDEHDDVEELIERYLGMASELSLSEVIDAIHDRGGLAVASHADSSENSLVSQIGFLPDEPFDALDLVAPERLPLTRALDPGELPIVTSSGARRPSRIGAAWIDIDAPELRDVFQILRESLRTGRYRTHPA